MEIVVTVDVDACMSSGECLHWAPGVFVHDERKKSTVVDVAAAPLDSIVEAARRCPNFAITVVADGEQLV
mgnify:CR=1 FL=1